MLGNLLAVKEDDGLVIDTVENQDTALVSAWSWGGEAALVDPPAVGDPFAVEAVELDVRVLDQAGAQQVVVDAAGTLAGILGVTPLMAKPVSMLLPNSGVQGQKPATVQSVSSMFLIGFLQTSGPAP